MPRSDPEMVSRGWYMLAGNPVRCVPELMSGAPEQRILRSGVPTTDIWGFAHELGHDFTVINATWSYMIANLESWPNIFTLHALEGLSRTAHQPNASTYCDGKAAYMANPSYAMFEGDAFLQLCFMQELTKMYGYAVWNKFFVAMNATREGEIPYAAERRVLWGWIRDRLSAAAGTDVTPVFRTWSVPLP